MAPVTVNLVEDQLKRVIHALFQIQLSVHGYQAPETASSLKSQIQHLVSTLTDLTSTAPELAVSIPPEIIAYVEDGRNPDIYTREFVELVQKGNQYLKGRAEAFGSFRDILAAEMSSALPELRQDVERVVLATSGAETAPLSAPSPGAAGATASGGGIISAGATASSGGDGGAGGAHASTSASAPGPGPGPDNAAPA
ncbi:hypothetical protein L228DRAFT_239163 [Xylona heveae TC161]|uniref:Mediator of RNA polymerase II transcription subunit 10 n=1 Tax=Xylona heveae (strain CBS 132557 / TC161) TaxID=1328760 RepID=A0A165GGH8_XYLHT|nr:hypothetical protein L228DRAFT_239163 [Xylona heveae TC161]KZF22157.1 hypothetical protein L228DRAFT_239163 [Xylona heveae TC161]